APLHAVERGGRSHPPRHGRRDRRPHRDLRLRPAHARRARGEVQRVRRRGDRAHEVVRSPARHRPSPASRSPARASPWRFSMSVRRSRARGVLAALALAALWLVPAARTAQAQAPPALTDSLRWDPTVRRGVLPNGIRWFVKKNGRPEARVSLRLAVPVGSTAEADDQQGLAHFTEHMNFNGSTHLKDADDLVGYLRAIGLRFGADANAYTSFDETVYMLEVPTDKDSLLHTGLDALSDFAGRAKMSDKEIDKERGVVLEEWRLGRGADERMQRQQFPVTFHDSRYAVRLPIGKPEIIQGASHARLRDYYKDWYRPEWMAVIAVGDIDPDRMERLIREHFSDLPK